MNNKVNYDCETVYLSYEQAIAMQSAIKEMSVENGIQFNSIYVSEPKDGQGNWADVMPTQAKYLIQLGMRMARILYNVEVH
jgi:hypothetical protein